MRVKIENKKIYEANEQDSFAPEKNLIIAIIIRALTDLSNKNSRISENAKLFFYNTEHTPFSLNFCLESLDIDREVFLKKLGNIENCKRIRKNLFSYMIKR